MTPTSSADGRPLVELYQVLPDAPLPTPAGRRAVLAAPTKALRHCPPMIGATSLGWYLYPPMDFRLRFDGQQTDWCDDAGTWHEVPPGEEATVPAWDDHVRKTFPAAVLEASPEDRVMLFNADPMAPNRVEMYTGVVARTAPGWSLLLRAPANVPRRSDYFLIEGAIETDWWTAPIPTILELTTPDRVVDLRTHHPLVQVQLVPSEFLRDPVEAVVGRAEDVPPEVWESYRDNRVRRITQERMGSYHRALRERRLAERGTAAAGRPDPTDEGARG